MAMNLPTQLLSDVVLVQMPDCSLTPSLALSLLKQGIIDEGISCRVEYASHYFVRHLGWELYDEGQKTLRFISARGWELLFSSFTGFQPSISEDEIFYLTGTELTAQMGNIGQRLVNTMHACFGKMKARIPSYLEAEADRILSYHPTVVGFSVMTQQRNASFALCRILKEKQPDLVTIMGGGICTPDTAPWFLSAVPALDYVFTGEGDRGLGEVCRMILDKNTKALDSCTFLAKRGRNAQYLSFDDLDDSPIPDFSEYMEVLNSDPFRDRINLQIPLEASRGCWWALKNRCRFCGMHYCPEAAKYRWKSSERFWTEIDRVFSQTGIPVFQLADCIIDYAVVRDLPEKCPPHRKNYVLFAECRSSLKDSDLKKLAENGFISLQPGIESLQDEVLDLMSKGCRTEEQLLFLIRCSKYKIKPVWNIICHIPGEEDRMYEEMLILIKKIHHLHPPSTINRMMLARGSVYHLKAEEFGLDINLRAIDRASDPNNEEFTRATADYFFTTAPGISLALEERLRQEHRQWQQDYFKNHVSLNAQRFPDRTEIFDLRNPEKPVTIILTGARKCVFDASAEIAERKELARLIGNDIETLDTILAEFNQKGLIYMKSGRVLALAVTMEES